MLEPRTAAFPFPLDGDPMVLVRMIDIMGWDDWIKLTDAEQEAVRRRYERPGSEAMPGSLSVEEQRCLLHSLTRPLHNPEKDA